MFYYQILCPQIPKAQKNTVKSSVFSALTGSECIKAARKMLMKLTVVSNFLFYFGFPLFLAMNETDEVDNSNNNKSKEESRVKSSDSSM
jgi:hypothetical protein